MQKSRAINLCRDPGDAITHIDKTWRNNRIASDHYALKRIVSSGDGFQSLQSATAVLQGIEEMRMIKRGHVLGKAQGPTGEVSIVNALLGLTA